MNILSTRPESSSALCSSRDGIGPPEWDALPLLVRASCLLADILVLVEEVEADLRLPEAESMRSAAPVVETVYADVDALLKRLSV